MLLEQAVRTSEMILAFALIIQSLEHIRGLRSEKLLGVILLLFSLLILVGFYPVIVEAGLLVIAVILLRHFQGPYNGGSDCMSLLVLLCLFLSHVASTKFLQEIALGYLAFQVTFSYFQSGYIKIINPEWRAGRALTDVFAITTYPVSESFRQFAQSSWLMLLMSWAVILFELTFPFSFLNQTLLIYALLVAVCFHLANAWLFGLNRFFWIWPAAYPIILWFQTRIIAA